MRVSYLKLGGLGVASSIALFTLCLSGCAGKGVNCPQVRLLRESGRSEAEIAASMQASESEVAKCGKEGSGGAASSGGGSGGGGPSNFSSSDYSKALSGAGGEGPSPGG